MCLAVPGKVLKRVDDDMEIDMQGNHLQVTGILTPDAKVGDWVLVHAGFAIQTVDEQEAKETFSLLREIETGIRTEP